MDSREGEELMYRGWCVPDSRSHSSLGTNGHGSVPKSDSMQCSFRTTCSFCASAGLMSSSHFHTTLLFVTLSPFAGQ